MSTEFSPAEDRPNQAPSIFRQLQYTLHMIDAIFYFTFLTYNIFICPEVGTRNHQLEAKLMLKLVEHRKFHGLKLFALSDIKKKQKYCFRINRNREYKQSEFIQFCD